MGNPPDHRSIGVDKKYGLDISRQKCRRFSEIDFLEFDHIYVMDRSNFSNVARLATSEQEINKIQLLLDEVDLDIQEVPDPYYGGDDGFEKVYQMIDMACEAIAKKLN